MPGKRLVLCIYKNPPASRILFLEDKDVNGQIMPLFTEPAFVFQYIDAHELQNHLGMLFFWQSYIHVYDGKQYQFRRIIAVDSNTAKPINALCAFAEIGAVTQFFCLDLGTRQPNIGLDCPTNLNLRSKPYYNSELTKDQDPMRALISAATLYCSKVYNQERMARARMQASMLQQAHNNLQTVPVQPIAEMPAIPQDAVVDIRPAAQQGQKNVLAAKQDPQPDVDDGFVFPSRKKTAKPKEFSPVGSISGAHHADTQNRVQDAHTHVAEMHGNELQPQDAGYPEPPATLIVRRLKPKPSKNAANRVTNTTENEDEFLAQCIAANESLFSGKSQEAINHMLAEQSLLEQRAAMEENDRNYALSLSERNMIVKNKAITLSFFIFMFYMTAQILNSLDDLEQDKKANRISDVEYSDKIANLNVQIMISCGAVTFAISKLIGRIANKCMDSKFAFALHRQLQAEAYTKNGSKNDMSEDGLLKTIRPLITR